jgi:hypothetical protein
MSQVGRPGAVYTGIKANRTTVLADSERDAVAELLGKCAHKHRWQHDANLYTSVYLQRVRTLALHYPSILTKFT